MGEHLSSERMTMEELEVFLRLAFAGLGLILTALTLMSWVRSRQTKILLAGIGFGMLAAEGLLLAVEVLAAGDEMFVTVPVLVCLNFLAMLFLYLSVLKR